MKRNGLGKRLLALAMCFTLIACYVPGGISVAALADGELETASIIDDTGSVEETSAEDNVTPSDDGEEESETLPADEESDETSSEDAEESSEESEESGDAASASDELAVAELSLDGDGEEEGEGTTTAVATIGDVDYDTLEAAIAEAQSGDTVTLLKDVELTTYVTIDKQVTVDLNGKTITRTDGGSTIFWVSGSSANLTIKDSGEGGTLTSSVACSEAPVWVNNGGTATLESGTIKSENSYGVLVRKGATFKMTGGAIETSGSGRAAICGNGSDKEGSTITISGGTITSSKDIAIYHPQAGTLTISGGTITGTTGVYVKSGTLKVTGGTINGTGSKVDYNNRGDGANATGDALVIDNCGYTGGAPSATISGGTFNSANADAVASYATGDNEAVTGFISGGTFSDLGALAYAKDGATITLDADCDYDVTEAMKVTAKNVTLDMNGHTVTVKGNKITIDGGSLTVTGNGTFDYYDDPDNTAKYKGYIFLVIGGGSLTLQNGTYKAYGTIAQAGNSAGTGTVYVMGGEYSLDENCPYGTQYMFNLKDNSEGSKIEITGGTFYGFDPSKSASESSSTRFLADGYVVEAILDATAYTVKPGESVAKIEGGNKYASLKDAINAAQSGDTVTLLANVAVASTIEINKSITLDLNDHTVTGTQTTKVNANDGVVFNVTSGTVTINNGTINGTANGNRFDADAVVRVEGAALTLSGVTIEASGEESDGMYGVSVRAGGSLVCNNCDIAGYFAAVASNNTASPVSITINGGTYTSKVDGTGKSYAYLCAAVYAPAAGTVTINGGTFSGYYGISVPYSNVDLDVAVNGGTFTGTGAKAAVYVGETEASNGGGTTEVSISGGTFSSDVNDYAAYNYEGAKNTDGTYGVVEATAPVISTEWKSYDKWIEKDGSVTVKVQDADSGLGKVTFSIADIEGKFEHTYEDAYVTAEQEYVLPYNNLAAGENTITITATDSAGNEKVETLTVNVDTAVPAISATWESYGEWIKKDKSVTVKVQDTDSGVAAVNISINGTAYTLPEGTDFASIAIAYADLDAGKNTIEITATDNVGNENVSTYTVYADKTEPDVASSYQDISYKQGEGDSAKYWLLKGKAFPVEVTDSKDNDSGVESVSITINNELYSLPEGTNFSSIEIPYEDLTAKALTDGETKIEITATDNVGNKKVSTYTVYADKTPPTVEITETEYEALNKVLNFLTFGIFGNAKITGKVTVTENGSGIKSVTMNYGDNKTKTLEQTKDNGDGTYTYEFSIPVKDMTEGEATVYFNSTVSFTAEDKVGNTPEVVTALENKTESGENGDNTVMIETVKPTIDVSMEEIVTVGYVNWVKADASVKVTVTDNDSGIDGDSTLVTTHEATYTDTTEQDTAKVIKREIKIPYDELGDAGTTTENTITIDATDNAGNEAATEAITVWKDDVAPEVEITVAEPVYTDGSGNAWYAANTTFTITLSDTGSGVNTKSLKATVNGDAVDLTPVEDQALTYTWTTSQREAKDSYLFEMSVSVEDNVGNKSETATETVCVDYIAPVVSISYDNTSPDSQYTSYYNAPRTATITVVEQNFDADAFKLSITNSDGSVPTLSAWSVRNTDDYVGVNTTYTATLYFSADGDYSISASCTDRLGHGSNTVTDSFTIDQTAPQISVTYNNNDVENSVYFKAARTATITITEHNFDSSRVTVTITATNGGKSVATPTMNGWSSSGNTHTATVVYDADGDYTFDITVRDMAGNQDTGVSYGSSAAPTAFTIDLTTPSIYVSGINNCSANNGTTIGFTVTITDKNLEADGLVPYLYAVVRTGEVGAYTYESRDLTYLLGDVVVSQNADGERVFTYTVENLPDDGYYSLQFVVQDMAGNVVSSILANEEDELAAVSFSVNRDGSVFWIETEHTIREGTDENGEPIYSETYYNELDGKYVNGTVKVIVHEVNIDPVDETEGEETVFMLNDGSSAEYIELVEGENYTKNSDAKTEDNFEPYAKDEDLKTAGWYETIYTLDEALFENDGTYSLSVVTYDNATNRNINTEIETGVISFVVDRTAPVITSNVDTIDVKKPIKADEYVVEFKLTDLNLDEETLVLIVDGEEIEPIELDNGSYRFVLGQKRNHEFTIEVRDKAGNVSETYTVSDLTVTTNKIALWYENKLAFWLTIAAVAAAAGVTLFIVIRRSKEEEEQRV